MARTEIITDDLDGSADAQPYEFTWDGVTWTIDLADKNRKKLEEALRPYLDKARPARQAQAKSTTTTRTRRSSKGGRDDLEAIRAWAQANGYKVGDRGRIAKSIIEEYDLAQSKK
jgi:hypothetical protein